MDEIARLVQLMSLAHHQKIVDEHTNNSKLILCGESGTKQGRDCLKQRQYLIN